MGGVGERAEHARHISQRRSLEPALGQGATRLALEIDDRDVVASDQHLSKMVVAVAADSGCDESPPNEQMEAGEQLLLALKQFFGLLPQWLRQAVLLTAEGAKDASCEATHRLVERALSQGGERLGREDRVRLVASERTVQFRGPPRDQPHHSE